MISGNPVDFQLFPFKSTGVVPDPPPSLHKRCHQSAILRPSFYIPFVVRVDKSQKSGVFCNMDFLASHFPYWSTYIIIYIYRGLKFLSSFGTSILLLSHLQLLNRVCQSFQGQSLTFSDGFWWLNMQAGIATLKKKSEIGESHFELLPKFPSAFEHGTGYCPILQ